VRQIEMTEMSQETKMCHQKLTKVSQRKKKSRHVFQ